MNTENHSEVFEFNYSAKQQEEVQRIREKYAPKEEDKLEQLRRLDAGVTRKGTAVSLAAGILGVRRNIHNILVVLGADKNQLAVNAEQQPLLRRGAIGGIHLNLGVIGHGSVDNIQSLVVAQVDNIVIAIGLPLKLPQLTGGGFAGGLLRDRSAGKTQIQASVRSNIRKEITKVLRLHC